MFGFLNRTTLTLGLVLILALGAISYYAYSEHTKRSLESQIAELNLKTAQQSQIIASQELTIAQQKLEAERNKKLYEKAQKEFDKIINDTEELKDKLSKVDLLAKSKTPLIAEEYINNTSNNIFRCFELLSGAPFNDKELAAKTSQEFNSSCPWFFTTE